MENRGHKFQLIPIKITLEKMTGKIGHKLKLEIASLEKHSHFQ